jgi:hypothetical protein
VKIVFAGYAALAYFTKYVIAEEPQRTQTKIDKRLAQLRYVPYLVIRYSLIGLLDKRLFKSSYRAERLYAAASSYTRPICRPPDSLNRRQLTDEERKMLSTNPMSSVGKQFIHLLDNSEELAYKIVGLRVTEDGITYEVRFSECVDSVEVSSDEMEAMVQDSVLVG